MNWSDICRDKNGGMKCHSEDACNDCKEKAAKIMTDNVLKAQMTKLGFALSHLWPVALLWAAFYGPIPIAPSFVAGMWTAILLAEHCGWRKFEGNDNDET